MQGQTTLAVHEQACRRFRLHALYVRTLLFKKAPERCAADAQDLRSTRAVAIKMVDDKPCDIALGVGKRS